MSGANHHCRNIISWQPLQFDKIHENLEQRLSAFSLSRRILKIFIFGLHYLSNVKAKNIV